MAVVVNNKMSEWKENETVDQLLKRVGYVFPLVIVKIDGVVIPRGEYRQVAIPQGAVIDVIHMISGG